MPEIRNPVLPEEEPLTRHWDQRKYANFRERVHAHTKIARDALKEKSPEKAIAEWQKLFGEDFARGRGERWRWKEGSSHPCSSESKGPQVWMKTMTSDTDFDPKSKARFIAELEDAGFEGIPEFRSAHSEG